MRAVVVGQVVVDEIFGTNDGRSTPKRRIGGKAFNIAVALAMAGAHVDLVSAVGNDDLGRRALQRIRELGVNERLVVTASHGRGAPPVGMPLHSVVASEVRTPTVALDEGRYGERSVVVDQSERLRGFYRTAIRRLDASQFDMVICTFELDADLLLTVADEAERCGVALACNPAPIPEPRRLTAPLVRLLNVSEVLTPNQFEARFLATSDKALSQRDDETAALLARTYNCRWVAVTFGARGWAWAERDGRQGSAHPPRAELRDKVGASDVFTAWTCLMRHLDADIEVATACAATAAALAIARTGGAERFPVRAQVIDKLRETGDALSLRAIDLLDHNG